MKTWEQALERFLVPWKKRKCVTGALVCGSFVTGNPDLHSDIDVYILLASSVRWRERGNRIVDGYLIEYFANPPEQIRDYFASDYRSNDSSTATGFVTGNIVFDKTGALRQLRREAGRIKKRRFERPNQIEMEITKYLLWDQLDNLQAAVKKRSPGAIYLFHNSLRKLFHSYAKAVGYSISSPHNVYPILTDGDARRKYLLDAFPDRNFAKLFVRAMQEDKPVRMCETLKKLTGYVHRKWGGFNIDGWKCRSPISV